MTRTVPPGSTGQSVYLRVYKDSGYANTTPLAYNAGGLSVAYHRDNGAAVTVTLTALASATAAYAAGGWAHVGQGEYRLDLPDAAIAAGASQVSVVIAEATDIRPEPCVITLDAAVSSRLAPTVAGRTLSVDTGNRASVDLASILGSPAAAAGLQGAGVFYNDNSYLPANTIRWGGSIVTGMPMPTYAQPSGFLATQFGVTVSSYTGGDTAGTTTLLSRITGVVPLASDYTAARAVKLDNLDAAVSSRMATFTVPASFAAADFTRLDVAVSSRGTYNGGNITGNLSGSVGSVTGNVGGSVVGSVASVTGAVTVGANSDKSGYTLTAAYDRAKTAATPAEVSPTIAFNPTINPTTLATAERQAIAEATRDEFERTDGPLDNVATGVVGIRDFVADATEGQLIANAATAASNTPAAFVFALNASPEQQALQADVGDIANGRAAVRVLKG